MSDNKGEAEERKKREEETEKLLEWARAMMRAGPPTPPLIGTEHDALRTRVPGQKKPPAADVRPDMPLPSDSNAGPSSTSGGPSRNDGPIKNYPMRPIATDDPPGVKLPGTSPNVTLVQLPSGLKETVPRSQVLNSPEFIDNWVTRQVNLKSPTDWTVRFVNFKLKNGKVVAIPWDDIVQSAEHIANVFERERGISYPVGSDELRTFDVNNTPRIAAAARQIADEIAEAKERLVEVAELTNAYAGMIAWRVAFKNSPASRGPSMRLPGSGRSGKSTGSGGGSRGVVQPMSRRRRRNHRQNLPSRVVLRTRSFPARRLRRQNPLPMLPASLRPRRRLQAAVPSNHRAGRPMSAKRRPSQCRLNVRCRAIRWTKRTPVHRLVALLLRAVERAAVERAAVERAAVERAAVERAAVRAAVEQAADRAVDLPHRPRLSAIQFSQDRLPEELRRRLEFPRRNHPRAQPRHRRQNLAKRASWTQSQSPQKLVRHPSRTGRPIVIAPPRRRRRRHRPQATPVGNPKYPQVTVLEAFNQMRREIGSGKPASVTGVSDADFQWKWSSLQGNEGRTAPPVYRNNQRIVINVSRLTPAEAETWRQLDRALHPESYK